MVLKAKNHSSKILSEISVIFFKSPDIANIFPFDSCIVVNDKCNDGKY